MKKLLSLLLVLLLYALAFAAALGVCAGLKDLVPNKIILFLLADAAATVVIWAAALIVKNSSMYDPYWSVQPVVLIAGYLYLRGGALTSSDVMLLAAVSVWAVRLTLNWIIGWQGMKHEDWRYANYRKDLKPFMFHITNFFGIMMIPTLIVFFSCIPAYYTVNATVPLRFAPVGLAVCIGAAMLQLASDEQMRTFRKMNASVGAVMDKGLWRYSRHPNYLGEISMWWGIFIMSIGAVPVWLITAPIAMTALFVFISIPLMEKRLSSRAGFAEYKRTTSMLLPLPPKKSK